MPQISLITLKKILLYFAFKLATDFTDFTEKIFDFWLHDH
jgi:hypothetical protein